jgi:molybdopterin-guanine dinucleotide biosynthesis protein A
MSRPRRFSEISGFVLAGGSSRRMGTDKACLAFGRERLVDRQVRLLRAVCGTVAIIAPRARLGSTEAQVYEDDIPGQGPLGGMHTGLRRARTEFSLFLGCDMPLMEVRFLRYLCEQALATPAVVTVPPPWDGGRYPLCVVLRRGALARLVSCLRSGQSRVGRFFSRSSRRTITKAEFAGAGFSTRIFCNLNTPEDYERTRPQWVQ